MVRHARILIVDPEIGLYDSLALALQREGYDPLTATAGQGALEILEQQSVDVILADLKMPDMPGLELLRRFQELKRKSRCPLYLYLIQRL